MKRLIVLLFSCVNMVAEMGGKFLTKFSAADNPIRISDFRFCASPVTSDSSSWVMDVSLGGVVNSWKNRIICLQMRLASLSQCRSVGGKKRKKTLNKAHTHTCRFALIYLCLASVAWHPRHRKELANA